jgi:hypothetical protein
VHAVVAVGSDHRIFGLVVVHRDPVALGMVVYVHARPSPLTASQNG